MPLIMACPEQRLRFTHSGGGFRFMPGCLMFSIVVSIVLTIVLNLLIRAF